jgi:hypothetical protein
LRALYREIRQRIVEGTKESMKVRQWLTPNPRARCRHESQRFGYASTQKLMEAIGQHRHWGEHRRSRDQPAHERSKGNILLLTTLVDERSNICLS